MRLHQDGMGTIDLVVGLALSMALLAAINISIRTTIEQRTAYTFSQRLLVAGEALQSLLTQRGNEILQNSSAAGFVDVLAPTAQELYAGRHLPSYASTVLPQGGSIKFFVRQIGTVETRSLIAFACGSNDVLRNGVPSSDMAALVVRYSEGKGLRTNYANPTILNGQAYQDILSPITGTAIVCTWAFLSLR